MEADQTNATVVQTKTEEPEVPPNTENSESTIQQSTTKEEETSSKEVSISNDVQQIQMKIKFPSTYPLVYKTLKYVHYRCFNSHRIRIDGNLTCREAIQYIGK